MTLDGGEEPGKLFVGGLSWETTIEKLTEYFCRYGEVIDCVVMKNPETGRSRGFGFVTFKDPSCVQIVVVSGPHVLDGRTIDPKECNPKSAQKGKREAKVGNFPKVFLGGLPPNVNESVLREYFSKYGKVMEVVIMYDQEKKKTRGFGFLSFDSEDTIDKVVSEHFVTIGGKQIEIKRAEPRDKQLAKSGHMLPNQVQQSNAIAGPMPPWNAMWGPQPISPMHGPPPGQTSLPQTGGPMQGMPNGMMPAYQQGAWNSQQSPYAPNANGWNQNYQNYQWPGYYPQGWTPQAYPYGSAYNTAYPGYGQTSTVASATAPAAAGQTPMAGGASATVANNVGYIPTVAHAAGQTQPVPAAVVTANAPSSVNYPQEASTYGPSRVVGYANPNYTAYPIQGQGDAPAASASTYSAAATTNQTQSSSYNRSASQSQGYHPYRRV